MFISDCLNVNKKGNLTIGGVDTTELAKEFGTPLYVLDESTIKNNCKKYKNALKKHFENKCLPIYASKAFSCVKMCKIIQNEGLGLDVVSAGELYTALKAGFNPELIHFHGNNKTIEELEMAITNSIGRIVVDNFYELQIINNLAKSKNVKCKISLRIKPGVEAHTHEFIKTGQIGSKFGFCLENGEALKAVKESINYSNIELMQLHCHIGSQIFESDPFVLVAELMMDFINEINNKFKVIIKELNLGGGFGIRYTKSDVKISYDEYIQKLYVAINKKAAKYNLPIPYVLIEPGRSIVGEAGITLYTVGNVKEIKNVRTYVSVDGGMTDNPRYALYKAPYTCLIANKALYKADKTVTIAGKCCESGDIIQENTLIQSPEPGDILAVLSTGAYNYSMASNYNRILKPAVVIINNGIPKLIIKRETFNDIIKNDLYN